MERQLESFGRRRRREIKTHETPAQLGRVGELDWDHGRIETPEGRSIYFHRNSVLNDGFDVFQVGIAVRYVEAEGDEGPQASLVNPLQNEQAIV
jgi:cold shock CspA family protein